MRITRFIVQRYHNNLRPCYTVAMTDGFTKTELAQLQQLFDRKFAEQRAEMIEKFAEQHSLITAEMDDKFAEQHTLITAEMTEKFAEQHTAMDEKFAEQRSQLIVEMGEMIEQNILPQFTDTKETVERHDHVLQSAKH